MGGSLTALLLIAQMGGARIPLTVTIAVLVVTFVAASFGAWKEEHIRANAGDNERQQRLDRVAALIQSGTLLTEDGHIPPPNAEATRPDIDSWRRGVETWTKSVETFLATCSPSAVQRFKEQLDLTVPGYRGVDNRVFEDVAILHRRLKNLHAVADRPEVYLRISAK